MVSALSGRAVFFLFSMFSGEFIVVKWKGRKLVTNKDKRGFTTRQETQDSNNEIQFLLTQSFSNSPAKTHM